MIRGGISNILIHYPQRPLFWYCITAFVAKQIRKHTSITSLSLVIAYAIEHLYGTDLTTKGIQCKSLSLPKIHIGEASGNRYTPDTCLIGTSS